MAKKRDQAVEAAVAGGANGGDVDREARYRRVRVAFSSQGRAAPQEATLTEAELDAFAALSLGPRQFDPEIREKFAALWAARGERLKAEQE